MGQDANQSAKLCSICGTDCSGKPRTKDAKGNYICGECISKAKEAKSALDNPPNRPANSQKTDASTAAFDDDNSFLLGLDTVKPPDPEKKQRACESCRKLIPEQAVVCMNCGYNAKTGENLKIRVLKPKEDKTKVSSRKGYSVLADIPDAVWILLVLGTGPAPLLAGVFLGIEPLTAIGGLCCFVTWVVVEIMMIIAAFRTSSIWGLAYTFSIFLGIGYFVKWWFVIVECEAELTKKLWILTQAALLIAFVLVFVVELNKT